MGFLASPRRGVEVGELRTALLTMAVLSMAIYSLWLYSLWLDLGREIGELAYPGGGGADRRDGDVLRAQVEHGLVGEAPERMEHLGHVVERLAHAHEDDVAHLDPRHALLAAQPKRRLGVPHLVRVRVSGLGCQG